MFHHLQRATARSAVAECDGQLQLTMHTDFTLGVLVITANRKHAAVRTLEKAVLLLLKTDETSVSGMQNGRLAVQLRRHVARLKRLLRDDPEREFLEALQKAILDAVKYLRRCGC